jgi:MFS family permease
LAAELSRGGKGKVLAAVGAGWFLSMGVRYIYASVLPFMRESFAMDLSLAGILLSTLWLSYALGQFPGGVLGDRYGEGNILIASTILSAVALLFVVFPISLSGLFVATAAFGFATGLYGPHRFTIFTDIYTKRAGTAVGITMAAGSVGNTVLPAIAVAITGYASWRFGFGVMIPLFIAASYSIYLFVPKRTSQMGKIAETFSVDTLRRLRTDVVGDGIPIVVGIHIVTAFVSLGFLGFYPTYLIEVKGFTPQTAALLYGSYFAFGIAIQPMTGMLRDRFGSKWTLIIITALFFLGLVALQFADSVAHIVALTLMLSQRNGLGVVTNTFIADTLDNDIKGSGLGLLRTSWILTGAMSPVFVGLLGDLGQLNFAFIVLAGIAGVATLMTLFVPRE